MSEKPKAKSPEPNEERKATRFPIPDSRFTLHDSRFTIYEVGSMSEKRKAKSEEPRARRQELGDRRQNDKKTKGPKTKLSVRVFLCGAVAEHKNVSRTLTKNEEQRTDSPLTLHD